MFYDSIKPLLRVIILLKLFFFSYGLYSLKYGEEMFYNYAVLLSVDFIDGRCVCAVNKHKTSEEFKIKECVWNVCVPQIGI